MTALDMLPKYVREEIKARKPGLRDDLLAIPYAESEGWTVTFPGMSTQHQNWHNAAAFDRGDISVWFGARCWRWARLVGDRYQDHRSFATLMEALNLGSMPPSFRARLAHRLNMGEL